tara:strand:+ start:20056 stop:21114 length:1059 start_codon:yes stop_codon:yes gene_type:complete
MSDILIKDLNYIYKNNNSNSFFRNKIILITGASGFLGSYFSNYFSYFIHNLKVKKIILVDININKIKNNLLKIPKNKCQFLSCDITKKDSKLFRLKKIDIIIHAASIASPTYYRKNPLSTAEANVDGLKNILNFSIKKKISRILYFSSSEIYGNPDNKNIPTKELYNGNVSSIGPRACYDESKRYGETLCYIYNQIYNLPIRIVRPFNNYGPFLSRYDKRLPSDLLNTFLKNKDIILFSDGKPKRTFCYVSDAICGYLKVIKHNKFDVFNIGNNDQEISVLKFTKIFKSIAKDNINYSGRIIFRKNKDKKYLIHNPQRRKPCLKKSKNLLNYNPKIKLEAGLQNYLMYYYND